MIDSFCGCLLNVARFDFLGGGEQWVDLSSDKWCGESDGLFLGVTGVSFGSQACRQEWMIMFDFSILWINFLGNEDMKKALGKFERVLRCQCRRALLL